MEEARNAGTGDSGDEDRNNPGTGDSERVLSSMVSSLSFSFMTKVGDVSLFRWLLFFITIVSYVSYLKEYVQWNWNVSTTLFKRYFSAICELFFVKIGFVALHFRQFD